MSEISLTDNIKYMYNDVLRELELDITFRERKNRMGIIAKMLIEKYHINAESSRVKAIIEDANSMDRYWRKILAEHKELRGIDYDPEESSKRILEEKKMIELGYETNHFQDLRKLKTL